jgi:hypothetical protein
MHMKLNRLNTSFLILILIGEFAINQTISSQELKHQRKSLGSRMTEEYDVLKDNKKIKEGQYTLKIENFISQIGSYKNNQRAGIWKIFYSKDQLELEYNYDTNELIYFNKKYFLNKYDSSIYQPIYLGGMKNFYQSVISNIDPIQMRWGNGSLSVSFEVDTSGMPHRFLLSSSCNYDHLDLLAIEAVKKVATSGNFKFLPAKKDGKPINFLFEVPINYIFREVRMGPLK